MFDETSTAIALTLIVCFAYGIVQSSPAIGLRGAFFFWFLFCLFAGVSLPTNPLPSLPVMVVVAVVVATAMTIIPIIILVQSKWWQQLGTDEEVQVSAYGINVSELRSVELLFVSIFHFLGNLILVPLAWIASARLLSLMRNVYS